jgi:hypothetical protein
MMVQAEPSGRQPQRWFILLLIPLVFISAFLHVSQSSRSVDVRLARERYSALIRERPIDATKARRARFYKAQFFLAHPQSVSYAAADLIRRFDGIMPPLRLLRVEVDPGLQDLGFALSVGVEAASLDAAQRKFTVFFSKLEILAGIIEASFSPGERNGRLHVFQVTGRAELP